MLFFDAVQPVDQFGAKLLRRPLISNRLRIFVFDSHFKSQVIVSTLPRVWRGKCGERRDPRCSRQLCPMRAMCLFLYSPYLFEHSIRDELAFCSFWAIAYSFNFAE